jgi:hypothetical protein
MKKTILITAALLIIICLRLDAKPDLGVSFNFFYNSLRPYGEWVRLDNNIDVWRPHGIHSNWRPYSLGRWNWTDNGWYWDSDEPYGWATYHYGRWYNDDYYGWIWIPDYEWAPSWVEWRYDDDYIGWAPLPPYASFHMDFGIRFSMDWHSRHNYWNFVGYNRFCDRRMNNFLLDERRVERIFGRTKYRTNYYSDRDRIVNGGIDRSFIERKAGYRIAQRDISRVDNFRDFERSRSNRGDRIIDYRPSERDLENSRTERFDIKRGESRSSLNRDKIEVFRDRQRDNNAGVERSIPSRRDEPRANTEREQTRREDIRQPSTSPNRDNRSRETLRPNDNQRNSGQNYSRPERNVQQERSIQPRREVREQNNIRQAQPQREPQRVERPQQRTERAERPQQQQRSDRVERPQQRTERAERPSSGSERKVERENNKSDERRR